MTSNSERPAPDLDHVRAALRQHDEDNAVAVPHQRRDALEELPEQEGSDSGDVVEDPARP